MADTSCEERIDAHLASRLDTFRTIMRIASNDDTDEDDNAHPCDEYEPFDISEPDGECAVCPFDKAEHEAYAEAEDDPIPEYASTEAADDAWFELPLCVDIKLHVTVQLSTGGPGDQFECVVDPEDGTIETITYRFLDWFDGATRRVLGDESDVAERFLSRFVEGAVATFKHDERGW